MPDTGGDLANITASVTRDIMKESMKMSAEFAKIFLLFLMNKRKEYLNSKGGLTNLKKIVHSGQGVNVINLDKKYLREFLQHTKRTGVPVALLNSKSSNKLRVAFRSGDSELIKICLENTIKNILEKENLDKSNIEKKEEIKVESLENKELRRQATTLSMAAKKEERLIDNIIKIDVEKELNRDKKSSIYFVKSMHIVNAKKIQDDLRNNNIYADLSINNFQVDKNGKCNGYVDFYCYYDKKDKDRVHKIIDKFKDEIVKENHEEEVSQQPNQDHDKVIKEIGTENRTHEETKDNRPSVIQKFKEIHQRNQEINQKPKQKNKQKDRSR